MGDKMSEITRTLARASIAKDAASLRLERAATSHAAACELISALDSAYCPLQGITDADDKRFAHEDLAGLSQQELWCESKRAEFLLAWVPLFGNPRHAPWLQERIKAVQAEQQARHQRR